MRRLPTMAEMPPHTRVGEPTFDADATIVYGEALDALEDAGIRSLVGGALALNVHTGIWRDTKDLDLFIRPADAPRALEVLSAAGFESMMVYETWLGKGWKGDIFVDLIWRNANGLFPVTEEWFVDAPRTRILGRDLRALRVEDLLLSKMMVGGRNRFDGADILHILHKTHETIDWERLAERAGEHVELLVAYLHMYRWGYPEWRERVPDDVLHRFHELADERADEASAPFRALLLDLQAYRVDVEAWGMPDPHRQALDDIFGKPEGRR